MTPIQNDKVLEAFESVPSPVYASPGQRPAMGQYNDRAYDMQQTILQNELDTLAKQQGLAAALRTLYEQQVDIGFIQDDLSQVSYFRYRASGNGEDHFFIVQFNPRRAERFKGAGRKTPPSGATIVGVADSSCFLCTSNIRWQHRGIQLGYQFSVNKRAYNALCNPFPFMKAHITMAAGEHVSQSFHVHGNTPSTQAKICRLVEDLYGIAEQLRDFSQGIISFSGMAYFLLIVVVMGGIYSGVFTPTEAAAMSAVYAFICAVFIYKDLGMKDVPRVLLNSANMSAMLLYIITNAVLFSFIMTNENIPQALADWMLGNGLGVITFLLAVNVILLLAGNFMEPSSIVLIFAPILFPVAVALGIHPVHFGILMVVNMEVGMCHPPVGLNLYVASGITKMGITELTVAVWPWLLSMLCFLLVVTYWPDLSLWLPRTMGML